MLHNISMKNETTNFRVVKKLAPSRPGAIKLARRYGEKLICVRHRIDPTGQLRVTTVELVVETTPIQTSSKAQVRVGNEFTDRTMRSALLKSGATWDQKSKSWFMSMKVAKALNLQNLVTPK
jgi:hypothetical protein